MAAVLRLMHCVQQDIVARLEEFCLRWNGTFEDSATRYSPRSRVQICSLEKALRPAKVIPLVLQCLSESHDDFASNCWETKFLYSATPLIEQGVVLSRTNWTRPLSFMRKAI